MKLRTRIEGGKSYKQSVREPLTIVASTRHSLTLSYKTGFKPKEHILELSGLELARLVDGIQKWFESREIEEEVEP